MVLPLRWMLILPIVSLLALGTSGLVIYVDHSVGAELLAEMDREITRAAVGSRAEPLSDEVDEAMPQQLNVAADGTVTPESRRELLSAEGIAALATHPGQVMTVGGTPGYRAIALPDAGGGVRVFALSLRPMDAMLTQLRTTLVVEGAAIFLATVLVLWLVSSRVAKPVNDVAMMAEAIAEGDLGVSIPVMGQTQETKKLSVALQTMVTQLSQQIEERDDALGQAEEATAAKARVLAEMAHELITPLTALVGYCQLYERGMLQTPAAVDHAMLRIGAGAQRLTLLVRGVLNLEGAGAVSQTSWSWVDLRGMLGGVSSDLGAAFPGRSIELVMPDEECLVWGDSEALQQVVLNVGANACRHTPSGTGLAFALSADSAEAEVRIIDHGPGIPMSERERVFEAFYRADMPVGGGAEAGGATGLGLGLAITRAVVEQHHGSIEIADTPGGGATVIIRLPRIHSGE